MSICSEQRSQKLLVVGSHKHLNREEFLFVSILCVVLLNEETSLVSKNIAAVVVVPHHTSIGNKVVRLRPVGVIKG